MAKFVNLKSSFWLFAIVITVLAWNSDSWLSAVHKTAWTPRDQLKISGCARPDPGIKSKVEDAWKRIEQQLKALRPDLLEALNPPASEQEVAELEADIGFPLPYDLRCSLLVHNGQKPHQTCFFYYLLSIDELRDRYHNSVDYAWGDQYYATFSAMPSLRNDSWCEWQPDSLRIADSGISCYLWIEMSTGELVSIFEESEACSYSSFAEWLSNQADAIDDGFYETDRKGRFDFVPADF